MKHDLSTRAGCNAVRLLDGAAEGRHRGHYESFFVRGNHPHRPLAFWVRYTLTVRADQPDAGVAEVWAIAFDGESGRIAAVKEAHPLASASLGRNHLSLRIGGASFEHGSLRGSARTGDHHIAWALDYDAPQAPLLLLPKTLYDGGFPRAKSLVSAPQARFRGALEVDGRVLDVDGWTGSQNHNWGSRHTDRYAWGQVAGFDNAPDAFLECATAQLKLGPLWSPRLTVIALRLGGEEIALTSIGTALRARASHRPFEWSFESAARGVRVRGEFRADASRFVALRYQDPERADKICLNSKLASCELRIKRPGVAEQELRTRHRAAFELLGDDAAGLSLAL